MIRVLVVPAVVAGALFAGAPAASADITWNHGSPNCDLLRYHMRNSWVPGVYATHAYKNDRHIEGSSWKWSYTTTLYSFGSGGREIQSSYTTTCSKHV